MRMSGRRVALVAVLSLGAGVIAATAEGEGAGTPPRLPAPIAPAPAPCRADTPAAAARPSAALMRSFGVLRRERTAADELPRRALDALRMRGLAPVDPRSARLLRTTADGGRAWIVPVPNANLPALRLPCDLLRTARPPRARRVPRPPRVPQAVPAPRPALPAPVPARPRPAVPPPPAMPAPPVPAPLPARAPHEPAEGLAVVALGGAPSGGGGAGKDLVRGLAPVAVDPCAGPRHTMQAISGVVPDHVDAVFLTGRDGTAIRTDVKDNAWSFVVPRPARPEERFVVWTGADGTPHVQRVRSLLAGHRACPQPPKAVRLRDIPVITPGFGPLDVVFAVPPRRP